MVLFLIHQFTGELERGANVVAGHAVFTFDFLKSRRRRFTRKRGILERLAGAFSGGEADETGLPEARTASLPCYTFQF